MIPSALQDPGSAGLALLPGRDDVLNHVCHRAAVVRRPGPVVSVVLATLQAEERRLDQEHLLERAKFMLVAAARAAGFKANGQNDAFSRN